MLFRVGRHTIKVVILHASNFLDTLAILRKLGVDLGLVVRYYCLLECSIAVPSTGSVDEMPDLVIHSSGIPLANLSEVERTLVSMIFIPPARNMRVKTQKQYPTKPYTLDY